MTPPAKESPDDLLLPSEAARILGYSTSMLRVWTDTGRLPVMRLTSGWRIIRRSDLDAFAAAKAPRKQVDPR